MKKNNSGVYRLLFFILVSLFLGLACNFSVEQSLPYPSLDLTPTRAAMPDPINGLVCASYFQQGQSIDFIQGTWTNDQEATSSVQACYDWMENAILHKQNCAQPDGGKSIIIVLIDKSRHKYDLPDDLDNETEFVAQAECSTP